MIKTVDRLAGDATITYADGRTEHALILSADPLGIWLGDAFVPWSAIDRVEVPR